MSRDRAIGYIAHVFAWLRLLRAPLLRSSPVVRSALLTSMILAFAWPWPECARADCGASQLIAGVTLEECTEEPEHWIVLRAELAAATVGIRVSKPAERGQDVLEWAAGAAGTALAVQGGPFRFPGFVPDGLTIGGGDPWVDSADNAALAVIAFDASGAGIFVPPEQVMPNDEAWVQEAVSGFTVVRDGVPVSDCERRDCPLGPLTGMGLSADGRHLIIAVADGWAEGRPGIHDRRLGEILAGAGSLHGIRTGGGATSVLWTQSSALRIPSSESRPRATAAFFGLINRQDTGTARIRGVVESSSEADTPLPAAWIRIETIDRELVVEGPTLTELAYWEHSLSPRPYVVRATHDGYREGCKYCPAQSGMEVWCSVFLARDDTGMQPAESCAIPAWGIDAGPWPIGDAGGSGRMDGGVAVPAPGGGCAVATVAPATASATRGWRLAWALLLSLGWRARGRRGRNRDPSARRRSRTQGRRAA